MAGQRYRRSNIWPMYMLLTGASDMEMAHSVIAPFYRILVRTNFRTRRAIASPRLGQRDFRQLPYRASRWPLAGKPTTYMPTSITMGMHTDGESKVGVLTFEGTIRSAMSW
jgi:hypothetical protein